MAKTKNPSPTKKKKGMITSYFNRKQKQAPPSPPKPRGRPRKQKTAAPPEDEPPAKKAKGDDETKPGRKYIDYTDPEIQAALNEAVDYFITNNKFQSSTDAELSHQPLMIFSKSTICDYAARKRKLMEQAKHSPPLARLNSGGNSLFNKQAGELSKSITLKFHMLYQR